MSWKENRQSYCIDLIPARDCEEERVHVASAFCSIVIGLGEITNSLLYIVMALSIFFFTCIYCFYLRMFFVCCVHCSAVFT
jgi:hypothetical protein